jgi:hypothetical protein
MLPMLWVTTPDLNMQASSSMYVSVCCIVACLFACWRSDRDDEDTSALTEEDSGGGNGLGLNLLILVT